MSRAQQRQPIAKLVHIPRRPSTSQSSFERVAHDNFRNAAQVHRAVKRIRTTVPLTPESLPDALQRLAGAKSSLSDFQLVRVKRYGHQHGSKAAHPQWRPQSKPAAFHVLDGRGRCVADLHPPPILPLLANTDATTVSVPQYLEACRNALPVAVVLGTVEELCFFVAQHHTGRSSSLIGNPVQLLSDEVLLRGVTIDSIGAGGGDGVVAAVQRSHFDTFVQALQSSSDIGSAATWWYRLAVGVPELMTAAFERREQRCSFPPSPSECEASVASPPVPSSAGKATSGVTLEDARWNCLPRERLLRSPRIICRPMFLLGEMKYGLMDVYDD